MAAAAIGHDTMRATLIHPAASSRYRSRRRGFSLIESLIATTILGVVTLALASAMATAQKLSFEGQKRMLASIAASDLMAEFTTVAYEDLDTYDGRVEETGLMLTLDGHSYPDSFWTIGRRTTVAEETIWQEQLEIAIDGSMITVTTFDSEADLAVVQLFIPEPTDP